MSGSWRPCQTLIGARIKFTDGLRPDLNRSFLYTQKAVSLSSCKNALYAMVAALCDGQFLRACMQFIIGTHIRHVEYTDSSSARMLVARSGVGKIKHLSGKVLWMQQQVAEKTVELRQIGTIWNTSDIGTKSLPRLRLLFLMHQCDLVFVDSGEIVGWEEFQRQAEKAGGKKNIQAIAKSVLRLGIIGLGPMQVNGQQCSVEDEPKVESWNGLLTTLLVVVILTLVVLCGALWRIIRKIKKDIRSIEHQLCDHYEYASEHQKRLDGLDARCEINEGGMEALDETTDCLR